LDVVEGSEEGGRNYMSLTVQCEKHPRYGGQTSPRASCEKCWSLHALRLKALVERLKIKEKEHVKD